MSMPFLKFMRFTLHFFKQELYGVDWDGPVDIQNDCEGLSVPNTLNPLSPPEIEALRIAINPLEQTDDLGLSLYLIVRQFVTACLA